MRIEVKGRNLPVSDELTGLVRRRTARMSRQLNPLAELDVMLSVTKGPAADDQVADATLRLKGTTLRARSASPDMRRSIALMTEDLDRQVKRHCEKRRGRRVPRPAETALADVVEPMPAGAAAEVPSAT